MNRFSFKSRPMALLAAGVLVVLVAACGGGAGKPAPPRSTLSAQAALGELIFNDINLSASGQQACASCHVSEAGHAQNNPLAAQLGGADLTLQGSRAAPSIRYLSFNSAFFFDTEGTPTGGFTWDGGATSLADQAGRPFLNPVEMAMPSKAAVIAKLVQAAYADEFKRAFGSDIFSRPDDAFESIRLALQAYQSEDTDFRPFSSKYDEFLRGNAALSRQEKRGLELFNDPAKGNCARCHPSTKGADGSHPLFTDFTYDNLGVPRNVALAVNSDPNHFDLGLCARSPGELSTRTDLCGAFKVPSLRNVALRQALFHNGHFKSLKEALTFYVQRDTNPAQFYPLKRDGSVDKFNDLPSPYKTNVNTTEAPYNRKLGESPALSGTEINDLIGFLKTLTDGWSP